MKNKLFYILAVITVFFLLRQTSLFAGENDKSVSPSIGKTITVKFVETNDAFPNPLKGFRIDAINKHSRNQQYATLARCYIKWNEIENDESDTIEKIRNYCNKKWADVEQNNIKIIPRVYLDWDKQPNNEYWPADMKTGDYSSAQFIRRVKRLILRLGECWDNDPRVAWIQMGIIGYWGEQHSPAPTPEMQKILGDTFSKAFKNKKILVRHADEFNDYNFGIYWDSWAHLQQINGKKHGKGLLILNDEKQRYLYAPIEGETAYNWGKYKIQPGDSPNDTLSTPNHLDFLLDSIRSLHCSALGWISAYDASIPDVRKGAAEVQKAFGYRFVLNEFTCPKELVSGQKIPLKFSVTNVGSAPFYENWPVEFSLINPATNQPVWKTVLHNIDLRNWRPGDHWDSVRKIYLTPPKINIIESSVIIPDSKSLLPGKYIAALAIVDPSTMKPALRFAIDNCSKDRYHPLCAVSVQ